MKAIERPFYFNASPEILKRANDLRQHMTEPEKMLWEIIGKKKMMSVTFRRQHPIDRFIVDFYSHDVLLVVEIDGDIHNNTEVAERDDGREVELKKLGLSVMRFTNKEVLGQRDKVVKSIQQYIIHKQIPSPHGEGKG